MSTLRPADLAREHGLSTQAVRNYERDGFIPTAERTTSGYRRYTELHAAALRAYLALVTAYGHHLAGRIMIAVHAGELDAALELIDRGHHQLLRDRETLDTVRKAIGQLTNGTGTPTAPRTWSVGELAHHLRVTRATLRKNGRPPGFLSRRAIPPPDIGFSGPPISAMPKWPTCSGAAVTASPESPPW